MRKLALLLFFVLSVVLIADPPPPVYDSTDDATGDICTVPGWCGNGNQRGKTYSYSPNTGDWEYSTCGYTAGIYCGAY